MCMCASVAILPHTSGKLREGKVLEHSEDYESFLPLPWTVPLVKMYFQPGLKETLVYFSVLCLTVSIWACAVFPSSIGGALGVLLFLLLSDADTGFLY